MKSKLKLILAFAVSGVAMSLLADDEGSIFCLAPDCCASWPCPLKSISCGGRTCSTNTDCNGCTVANCNIQCP